MKKLLLVATVLVGGMTLTQAGLNISIGIRLPLPHLAVVIRPPVVVCPPPGWVAPPVCPPRAVVTYPPGYYQPAYDYREQRRGYDRWERRERQRHQWR